MTWATPRCRTYGERYFRLLPLSVTRRGSASDQRKESAIHSVSAPVVDHGHPRFEVSQLSRFRDCKNLHCCEHRVRRLLSESSLASMREVFSSYGPAT